MKLRNTWYDRVLTWLSFAVLLAVTVYVIAGWGSLPEKLPMHYNAAGEIDSWGGKGILFLPLVLGWWIFGTLSLIERIPSAWNTVEGVRPEKQEKALRITKDLLVLIKCGITLNFSYMTLCTARSRPLGAWQLPVFLAAVFLPIFVTLVRLIRMKK